MYKIPKFIKSRLQNVDLSEGETIEQKMRRVLHNKEPIKDGAPLIYTERKEGVLAAYNIRTDRFEVAAEAMDLVQKNKAAVREAKMQLNKDKEDGKPESIQGTTTGTRV